MEVLYISSATSEKMINKISNKYMEGRALRTPQQTFDFAIASGLAEASSLYSMSIVPAATYPSSKCIVFRSETEEINKHLKINYIPFINFIGIKQIGISFYTFIKSYIWAKKGVSRDKIILLYAPYFPIMIVSYLVKILTKTKVVLIVPDLPNEAIRYTKSNLKSKLLNLLNKLKPDVHYKFDGYILLTDQMNEVINKENKPNLIIEGLIKTEDIANDNYLEFKNKKKVIMYAGAIYKKFGIEKLVEAFYKHVTEECELWLFGSGDFVSELKKYQELDKRIKYKGIKFRKEILEAEKRVTLLVNPRPTREIFTKYSFPSKTLEYMASGTPIASTRLEGIPNEYEDYIFWLEDESVEGIGKRINNIISRDREYLHNFGLKSQEWVANNKNNYCQSKKIIRFLEFVGNNNSLQV